MPSPSEPAKLFIMLLNAMGIKRGCFVDDLFSPEFPTAFTCTLTLRHQGRGSELERIWPGIDWASDDEDSLRTEAEESWNQLAPSARLALERKLQSLGVPYEAVPIPSALASWPTQFPLDKIPPEEWDNHFRTKLKGDPSKVLLFIDLSLGREETAQLGGIQVLKNALTLTSSPICVIFTNQVTADRESQVSVWETLSTAHGLSLNNAVVISKQSAEDPSRFLTELRRAFLNALAPEFLHWAKAVAQKSLTASIERLSHVDGELLDAVVIRSSAEEGIHPTETLFRLLDHEYQSQRHIFAIGDRETLDRFKALSSRLLSLAKIKDDSEPRLTSRVKKLRHSELYRPHTHDRHLSTPIALGDIWELDLENGEKSSFVLLGQPCDLLLRKNGKRSLRSVILAELSVTQPTAEQMESCVELPYFTKEEHHPAFVYLKKVRTANPDVLDAVLFLGNPITWQELQSLTAQGYPHVHPSLSKRMKSIAEQFLRALTPSQEPIKPSAPRLLFALHGESLERFTQLPDSVQYGCQRTTRLESNIARVVLQRYAAFISRPGLPHDFAKLISQEE